MYFSFLCSNVHAAGGLCISHSCVAMCMQLVDCVLQTKYRLALDAWENTFGVLNFKVYNLASAKRF